MEKVNQNKKLVSLEIENYPCILSFSIHEKINFYGLLVRGIFEDGTWEYIDDPYLEYKILEDEGTETVYVYPNKEDKSIFTTFEYSVFRGKLEDVGKNERDFSNEVNKKVRNGDISWNDPSLGASLLAVSCTESGSSCSCCTGSGLGFSKCPASSDMGCSCLSNEEKCSSSNNLGCTCSSTSTPSCCTGSSDCSSSGDLGCSCSSTSTPSCCTGSSDCSSSGNLCCTGSSDCSSSGNLGCTCYSDDIPCCTGSSDCSSSSNLGCSCYSDQVCSCTASGLSSCVSCPSSGSATTKDINIEVEDTQGRKSQVENITSANIDGQSKTVGIEYYRSNNYNKTSTTAEMTSNSVSLNNSDKITIDYYVLSESSYDKLNIYIYKDGSQVDSVTDSGYNSRWSTKTYNVTSSGNYSIKVQYVKDGSGNNGADRAWVRRPYYNIDGVNYLFEFTNTGSYGFDELRYQKI